MALTAPDSFINQWYQCLDVLNKDSAAVWVRKSMRFGSFMIYARGLNIENSDDTRYWIWRQLEGDPVAEAAELIEIRWVEITGRMRMNWFKPGQKYMVMFILQTTKSFYSSTVALLELKLPNGTQKVRAVCLDELRQMQWVNVKVGTFIATGEDGYVEFSLKDGGKDKLISGLLVAGVLIQPRA